MSDQNSPKPDPSEAVPGYTPPTSPEPAAPSAEPPAYTPPAAPGGSEPPAATPPAYTPPAAPGGYEPPAATPPAYTPPAAPGGYEPPAPTPPAYTPPPTGGYEPPSSGAYEPPPAGGFPPPSDYGQGGGYPPPPSGGYAPPPSGGYPPPPSGGYPPPPPPGGGGYPPQEPYGAYGAASGPVPFSVGAAFNYAWAKFVANIGPVLIVVVVAFAATFLVQMIGNLLTAGMSTVTIDPNTGGLRMAGGIGAAIVSGIFGLISYVVASVVSMGLIRAALDITYGRPISVASVFWFEDLVPFLIAQILVGLMLTVGLILCVVPGLIVAFFAQFTAYFVLDKKLGAVDAIKASFALVQANVGTLVGLFLAALLAVALGTALCLVGLLVAYPVVGIAFAFAYRKLQGEEVAA